MEMKHESLSEIHSFLLHFIIEEEKQHRLCKHLKYNKLDENTPLIAVTHLIRIERKDTTNAASQLNRKP
jgi:hypothetical protein